MASESRDSDAKAAEPLAAFMVEQMRSGADKDTIVARLQERGVSADEAKAYVEHEYPQIMRLASAQEFTSDVMLPAVTGGLLAAAVAGLVWAGIAVFTGYELGFVAWGIGLLAGTAVVFFSRGKRGKPLQVLAVGASVAGIAIGKYLTFFYYLKEFVAEEYGVEAAADLAFYSVAALEAFADSAMYLLGGFDLLWVGLAVYTAWRIPQGIGITASAQYRV